MSYISEPKQCPKCGGPIPAEAPQGLCPTCLLLQASLPTEAGKGAFPKSAPPSHEELVAAFPQLEILELIGQGGMGFVFKARQSKLERLVALKILPQSLATDPAFAGRFAREGRMLAKLSHPNIVTIHDFGQAGGWFYLLMEFVDGVNLRQAMKVGRFTSDQALAVVPSVCEALHYAHNEGILHRDIKPENILLDSKGRVKIADFGIAKLVGESIVETGLTGSGATLGTPHYMAPEQLEQSQNVDQRADIYSLGVVFYEMLTGELPIGRFAPPSEKSAVDPRMDEVVLRTLEKERERRTQTAGEVKTQVESIGASGPAAPKTQAGRSEPLPHRAGMATQSKIAVSALILVGILILGIIIGLFVPRVLSRISQFRQPTKTIELTSIKNEGVRISTWSSSPFPAGEAVVAVVKHPDGTLEDAMTQTITQRGPSGRHTTTVFSWQAPALFSSNTLQAASLQAQQNYLGRPLVLRAESPFLLFTSTNTAGGTFEGYLQFRPVSMAVATGAVSRGHSVEALVRFSRATNFSIVVLADYVSTIPPGHVLQAGAVESDGEEADVNTSSARSATLDMETCAWNFPETFNTDQKQSAAQQIRRLMYNGAVLVPSGQRTPLFSVTNDSGRVYEGFFELLSPPSKAKK